MPFVYFLGEITCTLYPCFIYLCLLYMDSRSHAVLESGNGLELDFSLYLFLFIL